MNLIKPMKTQLALIIATLAWFSNLSPQLSGSPLPTFFTYQGRLNDGANPANGMYDFRFAIYNALDGSNVVGTPLTNNAVTVGNGLFTVTLDFGSVFDGSARWLEIGVRSNGVAADFTVLSPRQAVAPAPYALYAPSAGSAATATTAGTASSVVSGSIGTAALAPGAVDSSRIAAGAIMSSNLSPALLSNTFWRLDGNSGTAPSSQFLGTTDNQPLNLSVNGAGALRLEPTTNAPNAIGGWSGNYAAPGVVGAAIAGGGNPATPSSNRIAGSWSFIGGGTANEASSPRSVVAGGVGNVIEDGGNASSIGGGAQNLIQTNNPYASIGGGYHNTVGSNAAYAAIGGGFSNTVGTIARYATIPGGQLNAARADYTLAAGRRAQANHPGAFVWADSTNADFASTSSNQFLIRASGGVGIGTNNPQSALHVAGTVRAESFSGSGAGLTEITGAGLADGSVTSAKIADGAVGSAQLASNAVTAANIANGSITSNQLADGAVGSAQLASNLTVNGTVTAASFAGSGAALIGVTPTDGSVTSAKLAAGAVSSVNIAAGAVGNTKLANSAVTVAAGTGLSGGGAVSLGGSVTLHNAGVVSLTGGGGVTVSASSGAVTLGCTATDTNIANAIVRRDTEGSFAARTISLSKNLSLSGNLSLPSTSVSSNGVVFVNGIPFLHNYNLCTFVGLNAGNFTMYGFANTGIGETTLKQNTWGSYNTASGYQALYANTNGQYNTANGYRALYSNLSGQYNTAIGEEALNSNTTGNGNVALGTYAGRMITTGNENIDIGNAGQASDSATIRIGNYPAQTNTFIAGIFDSVVATRAVCVDSSGHLGTAASSRRFKEAIEDMGDQSDVLLSLRPVSFRYKPEIDPQGIPQFGLIAEEVEQVAPALVMRDAKGAVHSVRYESVNAMLLNEFLKQHRRVEQLEQRLAELERRLEVGGK